MSSKGLISQTAFAKLVGISQPMVSRYIQEGKLSSVGNKLKMPDAQNEYLVIKNGISTDIKNDSPTAIYHKARAAKTAHQAKLLHIELQRKQGEVISIEDVCAESSKAAEYLRAKLIGLANKISGELVGLNQYQIHNKLRAEINECLAEIYELRDKRNEELDQIMSETIEKHGKDIS